MSHIHEQTLLSGKKVATKGLPDDKPINPENVFYLANEARGLATLLQDKPHPNIIDYFGLVRIGERPFIIMELLEEQDQSNRSLGSPLPVDEVLTIGLGIAKGLHHVHKHGLTHRDVKPSNFVGTKLIDFAFCWKNGLPIVIDGHQHSSGTSGYFSPAIVSGSEPTIQDDIYSLGVSLFEMLTGKLALPPGIDPHISRNLLGSRIADLAVCRGLTPGIAELLFTATKTTPEVGVMRESGFSSCRDVIRFIKSLINVD
ncbi:MAG: serine/threonine protein kinase [Candidatus Margulisbacteria bacterium]|nr:serine/threonine protein kinase [Candidatus Margulisiibacteriota bacterium]MBU1617428.1 serine/threonine protein kinase [Candidatus Margulisiibacteriota bacterium]